MVDFKGKSGGGVSRLSAEKLTEELQKKLREIDGHLTGMDNRVGNPKVPRERRERIADLKKHLVDTVIPTYKEMLNQSIQPCDLTEIVLKEVPAGLWTMEIPVAVTRRSGSPPGKGLT